MEVPGSSSTISEEQPRKQEGLSDTRTDSVKQSLISSEEWLQLHGLKSNKLTLKQILSQIGFPHCEGINTKQHWLENPNSMLPFSLWGGGISSEVASKHRSLSCCCCFKFIYLFIWLCEALLIATACRIFELQHAGSNFLTRDQTQAPCIAIAGRCFTVWATREVQLSLFITSYNLSYACFHPTTLRLSVFENLKHIFHLRICNVTLWDWISFLRIW